MVVGYGCLKRGRDGVRDIKVWEGRTREEALDGYVILTVVKAWRRS